MIALRKGSTNRVYNNTGQGFQSWSLKNRIDHSPSPKVRELISFFQEGLDKGHRTSALKRQVAAILAIRKARKGKSLAHHPHVRRFLWGTSLINPTPQIHCFPTWSLNVVLKVLSRDLFEAMAMCPSRNSLLK